MSIAVADNFQYKGGKPLDARMKFASVNDMTGTPAADLYDGCFAYVTGTKKYYSYDSSNTSDPTLGKWREFSAGAEYSDFTGATSQDAGAHGLVPAPTTADVDKYLKGDGSWGAIEMPNFDYSNEFGAENILSLTEKMIGQHTDGKPLYQKVITGTTPSSQFSSYPIDITSLNLECLVDARVIFDAGSKTYFLDQAHDSTYMLWCMVDTNGTRFNINTAGRGFENLPFFAVIKYTKTTDSEMSIGTPNDYSTTEKIVGTWIDGKPIWQKTVDCGALPNNTTKNVPHGISNLEYVVDVFGVSLSVIDGVFKPLPFVYQPNVANYNVGVEVSSTSIAISDTTDRSLYSKTYITLRYTKTS